MRPIILGCGSVGSSVARKLAASRPELDLLLADRDLAAAEQTAAGIGARARAVPVDVSRPESLARLLAQADVVLNTVGPFYRMALPVIDAAIAAKIHYVDINDDHDVAAELVLNPGRDRRAREAGTMLLIGCGSTPGFTNVLAKLGTERLDRTRSIRLCWVVPFVVDAFSPAVMDHLFHMLTGDVTQFIDGRHQKVPAYGGVREVEFLPPFGTYPAYFSGHGEPVTLPHFLPGLEEVTIRSYFFPRAADDLMRTLVERGFGSREPVPGIGASPLDFLTAYVATEAGRHAFSTDLEGEVFGYASQVEVCGERGGDRVRLVFEEHGFLDEVLPAGEGDQEADTADPTPVCARLALEAVLDGAVTGAGLLAPEACLDALPYVQAVTAETGQKLYTREEIVRSDAFA